MLSTNNINDYDQIERERQVIELYNQGKSTRDIAKELRMSLRDSSIILRKNQLSRGTIIGSQGIQTSLYYIYDYYSILLSLYFVAAVAAPSNLSKASKTYYTTLQSFSEHF